MEFEVWPRIISAAVVPAVLISACGLLCLAFYNRLGVVLARLRALEDESLKGQEALLPTPGAGETERITRERRRQGIEVLGREMDELMLRARWVRGTLFSLLSAIACLVLCSLAAGLGVLWRPALNASGGFFIAGMLCVLTGVVCAMRELIVAFRPIEMHHEFVERLEKDLPPRL